MEFLKKNLPMVIIIAAELVVGLLLLIEPSLFTKIISVLVGLVLIALGILFLVRIFLDLEVAPVSWLGVIVSVISIVAGVFCVFFFDRVIAVVGTFYGVMLIISAIVKVKTYFDLSKAGRYASPLRLVGGFVALVIGVLLIINPFDPIEAFWVFTGIVLIVQAALDIVTLALKINNGNYY